MKKLKILFPSTFLIWFVGGLIYVWFIMMDSWNRTLENFLTTLAFMSVLYFPIWIATLGEERANHFPKLSRFINNKIGAAIVIVIWLIAAFMSVDFFKIK